MLHFIKRATLVISGSMLTIAGAFIAIAGAVSGFGSHGFLVRIGYALSGVVLVVIGMYWNYVGSNRNLGKLFEDILFTILNSF